MLVGSLVVIASRGFILNTRESVQLGRQWRSFCPRVQAHALKWVKLECINPLIDPTTFDRISKEVRLGGSEIDGEFKGTKEIANFTTWGLK
jgi:hypothetical protein